MEAPSERQQSMQEFFTPGKARRVWQIILAVLTSLMMIGAANEFTKPKPEPERMTHASSDETHSYIDVLLLSEWVYQVSGDENYTFYEAMDTDLNWFLVSLDEKAFQPLRAHVDAYNAYFTDDYLSYSYPEPTRLYGMPTYISSDDISDLSASYGITLEEFDEIFGGYYLNEGASNANLYAMLFLVGAVIFGMFLLALVLQSTSARRNYRKSEQRLYELGMLDEAEIEFSASENVFFPKTRLKLSMQFVYCGSSGWVLPYTAIGWAYQRTQRSYGIAVGKQIVAGLVDGKTALLATQHVNDEVLTHTAQTIYDVNPNCLIGYSFDNIKLYHQRVKEYKQNHPK
jgi:hypothetical protein